MTMSFFAKSGISKSAKASRPRRSPPFIREHYKAAAERAAEKNWAHIDYLENLAEGEAALHRDRSIRRRILQARFPVIKTLDQFNWSWPNSTKRSK